MLTLFVCVMLMLLWRLRTVWDAHVAAKRSSITAVPVLSVLCAISFCLVTALFLLDPESQRGLYAADPPVAKEILIMLSQLTFLFSCTLPVRFLGLIQARFHAPTRKAVRALDALLCGYLLIFVAVFAALVAVNSPLFTLVGYASGTAYVLALAFVLRYFSHFVDDALSGQYARDHDYRATVLRLRDLIRSLHRMMLVGVANAVVFLSALRFGPPLFFIYGAQWLRILQLIGMVLLFLMFRPAGAGSASSAAQSPAAVVPVGGSLRGQATAGNQLRLTTRQHPGSGEHPPASQLQQQQHQRQRSGKDSSSTDNTVLGGASPQNSHRSVPSQPLALQEAQSAGSSPLSAQRAAGGGFGSPSAAAAGAGSMRSATGSARLAPPRDVMVPIVPS